MPLFPFERFRIESSLTPDEVRGILGGAVEPRKTFRLTPGRSPFQGEVGNDDFDVTRMIGYRNSFIPRIRGRIIATSSGSIIEGTMTLHLAVLCFMTVWFGMLFLNGGMMWTSMLAKGAWQPVALVPLGMLAFGWILTSGGFTYEARKARAMLTEMLTQSTVVPKTPSLVT